jgi:hypothetical protein
LAGRAPRAGERAALRDGAFGPARGAEAREAVAALARGLLAHQRADGAFEAGPDGIFAYEVERVAGAALALAALAEAEALGHAPDVPGLAGGIDLGVEFLRSRQGSTGLVGEPHVKDAWSPVEATAATVFALATRGRDASRPALEAAARALARLAQGSSIRNGWTRALAAMAVDRLLDEGEESLLGRPFREALDRREANTAPDRMGRIPVNDWNLAEAICRTLLEIRRGADPFLVGLADAAVLDLPEWRGQVSDCKTFWSQAWVVARTGRGEAWFSALLDASAEAPRPEDLVPGSFYATPLDQTSALLLALAQGLRAEPGS